MNRPVLHVAEHPVTGWQITNPDGQHLAYVDGSHQDALEHAQRLLDGDGIVCDDEHER